jgi:hypothetical protein
MAMTPDDIVVYGQRIGPIAGRRVGEFLRGAAAFIKLGIRGEPTARIPGARAQRGSGLELLRPPRRDDRRGRSHGGGSFAFPH